MNKHLLSLHSFALLWNLSLPLARWWHGISDPQFTSQMHLLHIWVWCGIHSPHGLQDQRHPSQLQPCISCGAGLKQFFAGCRVAQITKSVTLIGCTSIQRRAEAILFMIWPLKTSHPAEILGFIIWPNWISVWIPLLYCILLHEQPQRNRKLLRASSFSLLSNSSPCVFFFFLLHSLWLFYWLFFPPLPDQFSFLWPLDVVPCVMISPALLWLSD